MNNPDSNSISRLEEFLGVEYSVGRQDSEGEFSLSHDQAIAKLAKFQLAEPGAWILKVVQGAVRARSGGLRICITNQQTTVRFDSQLRPFVVEQTEHSTGFGVDYGPWNLEDVEAGFHSTTHPEPGLGDFIQGLWSVGVQQAKPFLLEFEGSLTRLRWDGVQLSRERQIAAPKKTLLTISHRGFEEPPVWKRVGGQAAFRAQTHRALCDRAFLCPVPLSLDNRRLDRLQGCAGHGWTQRRTVLSLGWSVAPQGSGFSIPLGSLVGDLNPAPEGHPLEVGRHQQRPEPSEDPRARVAWVVSAHLDTAGNDEFPSQLVWFRDGVVVGREKLPITPSRLRIAAFASAQQLQTDLTGLTLVEDRALAQERRRVYAMLAGVTPLPALSVPRSQGRSWPVQLALRLAAGSWKQVLRKGLNVSSLSKIELELNEQRRRLHQELNHLSQIVHPLP